MHAWHPMVIHFPLVALLLAVTLDVVGAWTRSIRWRDAATLVWWVGLLGAAAAVTTGLIAYGKVEHSEPAHLAMTLHRNLALFTVALLVVAAVWRWRRPQSRLAAGAGILGALGLLTVGYLGGDLVFRHGLGIPSAALEQITHERGGEAHHHGESEAEEHAREHADSSIIAP
ncbi:MAG: DUF2231 domain-containing protein [Gemmatimonadota bacterium]|nr:DUF2231 domain-containing protein [Gemmatimonadota bacterium]